MIKKYPFTIVYALLIGYLSVRSLHSIPLDVVSYGDKVAHFGVYALLGFLILWEHSRRYKLPPKTFGIVLLVVALYGLLWEFVQGSIPHRSFDWADALANASGGLAAVGLWVVFKRT